MASEEEGSIKDTGYKRALLGHLSLKAKLLFFFFLGLFLLEMGVILFTDLPKELLGSSFGMGSLLILPTFLGLAALCEGIAWRFFELKKERAHFNSSNWVPYGIAVVESLFPSVVMFWMIPMLMQSPHVDPVSMLDAPPVFVYFFFIILSALHLDYRLCIFTGLLTGGGYLFIYHHFLPEGREEAELLSFMGWFKSAFLLIGGFLAGAIAELTRRTLESSLEAKDRFIHRLDEKVKEKTLELRNKNELLEYRNREITDSIDYARRIQNALLQRKGEGAPQVPQLPEHFILLKPQSQVSGDFHWIWRTEGYVYLAAMDCTGHGVPGAFMSMLGISQLDEIMAKGGAPSPGELLSELRKRVVRELGGTEEGDTAKDGMDGAVVKMSLEGFRTPNSKTQDPREEGIEIEFAGAQNPLYVVRKGMREEDSSTLLEDLSGPSDLTGLGIHDRLKPFKKSPDGIEIKGDPMPVGYDEHAEGDFTTVTLRVQKGDMLYIFSDGYADQFGGEKGKKFRYGPFKKLLAELHEKPLEEQKAELDRVFEKWKAEGEQEQIDDLLVMGVRVGKIKP